MTQLYHKMPTYSKTLPPPPPMISFTILSQPLTAPTSTRRLNARVPTYDHTAVMALALGSTVGALVARAEKMVQASAMTRPCRQTPA